MRRYRRNSDWEDLPPLFAARPSSAPTPMQSPAQDLELPPMFFVPAPAPAPAPPAPTCVSVSLDVRPEWREGLARVLSSLASGPDDEVAAVLDEALGMGELLIRSRRGVLVLHRAFLAIAADASLDFATRAAALEVLKRIEASTGIDPQEGLFELAQATGAFHLTLGVIPVVDVSRLRRRPLRIGPSGDAVDGIVASFPEVFVREYARACREFEDRDLFKMYDFGDEYDDPEHEKTARAEWRHYHAFGAAMHEFQDLLQRSGLEAMVTFPNSYMETDEMIVLWRDPVDPLRIQLVDIPWRTWSRPGFEDAMVAGTAVLGDQDWRHDEGTLTDEESWENILEEGYLYNPRRRGH